MSTLNVNNIISNSTQTPILQATGNIVQFNRVRYDSRTTWSSNNSGNGTEITPLRLSIAPRHSGNLILCQWVLSGDYHHDNVFTIFRDGGLITTGGEQGYNNEVGNNRWSGFVSSTYDAAGSDTGSTPHHWFIQYFCNADSTSSRSYGPACRSAGGSNYTLHLNRTGSSTGQDGHEMTVSTGVIYEITR